MADLKDVEAHRRLQRKQFRQNIHRIWEMVKAGRRNELSDRDNDLALILMEHQEYADHFENTAILDGREYDAGSQFNPFLHISTHQMVEDQLAADLPPETGFFCEAMEEKGLSRHEAVHFVIMILLHLLYSSAAVGRHFDKTRYRRLLERCTGAEPSEVEGIVERDFAGEDRRKDLH